MLEKLLNIIKEFTALEPSAKFYLVGGCVRDSLMDSENGFNSSSIKDFDIEVFNIHPAQFTKALFKLGLPYDEVGQSFGVYKVHVDGETFDFAFPRSEKKVGQGYKGFEVEVNPFLSLKEAASRRDLTINSVMYDLQTQTYVDFFEGIKHIEKGYAHPTSEAFKEDPLRVLRAFQFVSRFGLNWTDALRDFSCDLLQEKKSLTPERVWVEWEKWATKSKYPALGINFLVDTFWEESEISNLIGINQEPSHHPEGDAYEHTLWVVRAAKAIAEREQLNQDETIILMLAALCHDFGKANTTFFHEKKQKWVAYNHQITGVPLAESFLNKINCPEKYRRPILTLVREHMVHLLEEPNAKNVRKLVNRLIEGKTTFRMLCFVTEADNSGRPPLPTGLSPRFIPWIEQLNSLGLTGNEKVPALVTGDELIALGMKEGKELGDYLKHCYEEQMCGKLTLENKQKYLNNASRKIKQHI